MLFGTDKKMIWIFSLFQRHISLLFLLVLYGVITSPISAFAYTWVEGYTSQVDSTHFNFSDSTYASPTVGNCSLFTTTASTCISSRLYTDILNPYAYRIFKGNFPDTSSSTGGGTTSGGYNWSAFNNFNFTGYFSTAGNYWIGFFLISSDGVGNYASSSPAVYVPLSATDSTHWSTSATTFNPNTHFTSFTVSTSTATVHITGYWNATTTAGITEQLEFYQYSSLLGQESYTFRTASTTGLFDWTFPYLPLPTPYTGATTTPTITANTTFYAKIYQYDTAYFNDPFSGIVDPRYKTLLVSTSTTLTAPTTNLYNLASTTALFAYPEYECGITSFIGCIKNALIWAFYPTQDTINNYNSFLVLIQSKAPIGYFSLAKSNINNLSATSTKAFTVTIPKSLKDYIFHPFDIGLASILWFFFLMNFYKRLKHITI